MPEATEGTQQPDPNSFEAIEKYSPRFGENVRRDINVTYDVVIQSLERMDLAKSHEIKANGKYAGWGESLTDKYFATPKDQLPFPQAKAEDFDIKFNNGGNEWPTLTLTWSHQPDYSETVEVQTYSGDKRAKKVKPARVREELHLGRGLNREPFYYRSATYLDENGREITSRSDVVSDGKVSFAPRPNGLEKRDPVKVWQFENIRSGFQSHRGELLEIQESCKKAAAEVRRSPLRWVKDQF